MMTTPQLDAASFAGHEGDAFRVGPPAEAEIAFHVGPAPEAEIELVLKSVTTWGAAPGGAERQPFTLLFHGPAAPVLREHTYRFDHPSLGAFDIFIVPIGPDSGNMRYEAVFT